MRENYVQENWNNFCPDDSRHLEHQCILGLRVGLGGPRLQREYTCHQETGLRFEHGPTSFRHPEREANTAAPDKTYRKRWLASLGNNSVQESECV